MFLFNLVALLLRNLATEEYKKEILRFVVVSYSRQAGDERRRRADDRSVEEEREGRRKRNGQLEEFDDNKITLERDGNEQRTHYCKSILLFGGGRGRGSGRGSSFRRMPTG